MPRRTRAEAREEVRADDECRHQREEPPRDRDDRTNFERLVEAVSASADLVVFGFTHQRLQEKGTERFLRHPSLRDVLFVSAEESVRIE